MNDWFELLGRLHPLVLHLPIGILVLLVLLEAGNLISRSAGSDRLPDISDGTRAFILFCLGLSTILSAAFGLMLSNEGGYDDKVLFDHRLYGLLCAALALMLFLVQRKAAVYAVTLMITVLVMILAGHNGGSLTHGSNYLAGFWGEADSSDLKRTTIHVASLEEVDVFAHAIYPIFDARCVTCHGDSKQKADLRLDSWESIEAGGENGPVLVSGDASSSAFIERILLPENHDDHMPPDGKPQLAYDEIRLLEWWVDAGAPSSGLWVDMDSSSEIEALILKRLGIEPVKAEPLPEREWVLSEARRLENELGIIVQPLHPVEPWLEINAHLQFEAFGDEQLAALEPLAVVIQRLDLGETAITDAGLALLEGMVNLETLKLDRTGISDGGLITQSLPDSLHSLTLFSTAISDEGIVALNKLPYLKSVYLWDTEVTSDGAARLKGKLSDDRLIRGLRREISQLESQIQAEQVHINLGESAAVVDKGLDDSTANE